MLTNAWNYTICSSTIRIMLINKTLNGIHFINVYVPLIYIHTINHIHQIRSSSMAEPHSATSLPFIIYISFIHYTPIQFIYYIHSVKPIHRLTTQQFLYTIQFISPTYILIHIHFLFSIYFIIENYYVCGIQNISQIQLLNQIHYIKCIYRIDWCSDNE